MVSSTAKDTAADRVEERRSAPARACVGRAPPLPGTETETLSAWMGLVDTRDVILNPAATQMGFGWYQEPSGKIWWTMVTGQ